MDEELMEIVEKVDTPHPLLYDVLSILSMIIMIGGAVLLAITVLWDPIQGRMFVVGDKQRAYILYSIFIIIIGYAVGVIPEAVDRYREWKRRRSRRR